jgi:shikimate kinase
MSHEDELRRPIFLVGFRGAGKTSAARLIAEKLSRQWIDADAEAEKCAGCTITEMFHREGEQNFRDLEVDVLRRLARTQDAVISTGGGVVLRQENRRTLKETGFVAWLKASPETIQRRLEKDPTSATSRPTLTGRPLGEEIRCLLDERDPYYRDVSDVEIDTEGLDPAAVADRVIEAFSRTAAAS